jgi:peptide/nickel transport system substrate-binding protein
MSLKSKAVAALICVSAFAAGPASADGVLRVAPHADLKVLDPFQATIYISRFHGYMIFDTLFGMDAEGKVQPQMLQTYTASPDRKTWTFVLRDGLVFTDGAPVTSQDVVASLNRWARKDLMAQDLFAWVSKLEAVDAKTVRMTLSAPYGLVLETLGKPNSIAPFIVPKRLAESPLDKPMPELIGSGPFIFKADEYKPGEKVVYVKNPRYVPRKEPASGLAGGKVVNVDRVEWVILKDPQTQMNALLTGAIDMLESPASEQMAALKANPDIQLLTIEKAGMSISMRFNHKYPPFTDQKVRQAAMLAIGQEPVLRTQMGSSDYYKTCLSFYPCGSPLSTTNNAGWISTRPQTEKAKALLKTSSYKGEPIVLLHPTDLAMLAKAPLATAQLLRQAGFNVDLQSMDWATFASRRMVREPSSKGGWDVFLTIHSGGDLLNPISHPIMGSIGDKSYYGWAKDDRIEALRSAYAMAATTDDRKRIAEEVQLRALDQGLFYPMGQTFIPVAIRKNAVKGLLPGFFPVYWGVTKQ